MKIGIWSDSKNFPSLPLMKLSAYYKQQFPKAEIKLYIPLDTYDLILCSKVFSFTKDIDGDGNEPRAGEVIKGGTGYAITVKNGKEVYNYTKDKPLPPEAEHVYPDYSLFPDNEAAIGFITRGCPRRCGFCIVSKKEGCKSRQIAELSEFWRGQKHVKLLDPNILACENSVEILKQLADSGATIEFTQGLDVRFCDRDIIKLLNNVKANDLRFAWDNPKDDLSLHFEAVKKFAKIQDVRNRIVYILTGYNSTFEENLYRIVKTKELGFSPYVMIYQKQNAPKHLKDLQRYVNNRIIYRSAIDFWHYIKVTFGIDAETYRKIHGLAR
jgi:hypothetical protein